MGSTSIYICNNCKNEFKADEGGGFEFALYRCVKCDHTKSIKHDVKDPALKCYSCDGELRNDIGPMCYKCKSRDVRVKDIEILYD